MQRKDRIVTLPTCLHNIERRSRRCRCRRSHRRRCCRHRSRCSRRHCRLHAGFETLQ